MPQKRYKPEEIIHKLRVAEVELSKGYNTGQICLKLGITEQTYYRWRKQYGGMKVEQARRFKELEAENAVIELDKEQFSQDELEIGTVLQSLNSDGQPIYAQVAEIKEKTVLLDFNHPLASKTLFFDIKVLDIQEVPTS